MKKVQTILGEDIPITTRGILYLGTLHATHLEVTKTMFFDSVFESWQAYANIPNPESQLVYGDTFDELINSLNLLHKNMKDISWIEELHNYI